MTEHELNRIDIVAGHNKFEIKRGVIEALFLFVWSNGHRVVICKCVYIFEMYFKRIYTYTLRYALGCMDVWTTTYTLRYYLSLHWAALWYVWMYELHVYTLSCDLIFMDAWTACIYIELRFDMYGCMNYMHIHWAALWYVWMHELHAYRLSCDFICMDVWTTCLYIELRFDMYGCMNYMPIHWAVL